MKPRTHGLLLVLALVGSVGTLPAKSEARVKTGAWVLKVGALLDAKPAKEAAFALGTDNNYLFGGPFWLALGSRIAINGNYFGWDLEVGFLLMFKTRSGMEPTFRAAFMFGGRTPFEEAKQSNFQIGSSFGPGFRYRFRDSQRAICLDASVEVGKYLREPKQMFVSFMPTIGFEF